MSLSSWFRDYVYIPLGGNRPVLEGRLVWNLFVVWSLTRALAQGKLDVCCLLGSVVLRAAEFLKSSSGGKTLARLPGIVRLLPVRAACRAHRVDLLPGPSLPYAFSFLRALFVPGMGAPDALSWLALYPAIRRAAGALPAAVHESRYVQFWAALGKTRRDAPVGCSFLLVVLGLSVLSMAGSGCRRSSTRSFRRRV